MVHISVVMKFPKQLMERPVVSELVRETGVVVNILRAHVTPEEDGSMVAVLAGARARVDDALQHLRRVGVQAVVPAANLIRDESRCVHCGACVGQCPTGALAIEHDSRRVRYLGRRCIACELCIVACAYGALEPFAGLAREKAGA